MGKHYILEDGNGTQDYTIMINYNDEDESGETQDEEVAILTGVSRKYAETVMKGFQHEYDKEKKEQREKFLRSINKLNWIERLFKVSK